MVRHADVSKLQGFQRQLRKNEVTQTSEDTGQHQIRSHIIVGWAVPQHYIRLSRKDRNPVL